ncbi:MAG: dehydro coenzyme reductase / coenzyme F420-0:L-glutamate ligase / coenzyme [Nocardioidaceae bacterium]|nr:dehydro coenzyme reductase / coenzyme F420-0:L-glutamate ligase / coenzyme [Nocardioidaceae bacterium]
MITVWAPDGVGEVRRGDDLADLLLPLVDPVDGDIVCVTSKAVSKAEGQVRAGDRAEAVAAETVRLVARRGPLSVVVNRLGLTMAAAGVDASNVEPGHVVLLPEDPDASARALRAAVAARTGANVGVLVTDTAGRAWREGQTDIAIGAAGLVVVDDHAGRTDAYGNDLQVTAPAVADELAGAAELAAGKLRGRPFTVVRGRGDLVLPPGDDGPGADGLLRPAGSDLFGLGAREAVLAALSADPGQRRAFGAPADPDELAGLLKGLLGDGAAVTGRGDVVAVATEDPRARWVAEVAAYAHGWRTGAGDGAPLLLRPDRP